MMPLELVRTFYESVVSKHRFGGPAPLHRGGLRAPPGRANGPFGPRRDGPAPDRSAGDVSGLHVPHPRQHWAAPYVISECVMEGTHLGPWPGKTPTGKRLTFTGVNVDRVEHGKIVEHGGR